MFVDYAKIYLKAGDGGDGCVSFRREKYVPRGGPDGGDGGRGGHIILVADAHMTTLLDFRQNPHYTTKRGQHGMGSNCTGRDAEDLMVKVPLGTTVSTPDGEVVADLVSPGQEFTAAEGGKGGRGNQHYATARNKAPRKFTYGGDGQERTLVLELKVIADVGLVGLPNAGKSTLLARLTAATPKIASYPFTTIHPNLGVMLFADGARCTIADIPGLIEGAHTGAGLGARFLRHIERTKVLVHLVGPPDDGGPADAEHYLYAHDLVNQELRAYSDIIAAKPQVVCVTKTDLLDEETCALVVEAFRNQGVAVIPVCAHTGSGLEALEARIREELALIEPPPPEPPPAEDESEAAPPGGRQVDPPKADGEWT